MPPITPDDEKITTTSDYGSNDDSSAPPSPTSKNFEDDSSSQKIEEADNSSEDGIEKHKNELKELLVQRNQVSEELAKLDQEKNIALDRSGDFIEKETIFLEKINKLLLNAKNIIRRINEKKEILPDAVFEKIVHDFLVPPPPPPPPPASALPSTSVPSTSVPSTSVPSTSLPSTSLPSTSVLQPSVQKREDEPKERSNNPKSAINEEIRERGNKIKIPLSLEQDEELKKILDDEAVKENLQDDKELEKLFLLYENNKLLTEISKKDLTNLLHTLKNLLGKNLNILIQLNSIEQRLTDNEKKKHTNNLEILKKTIEENIKKLQEFSGFLEKILKTNSPIKNNNSRANSIEKKTGSSSTFYVIEITKSELECLYKIIHDEARNLTFASDDKSNSYIYDSKTGQKVGNLLEEKPKLENDKLSVHIKVKYISLIICKIEENNKECDKLCKDFSSLYATLKDSNLDEINESLFVKWKDHLKKSNENLNFLNNLNIRPRKTINNSQPIESSQKASQSKTKEAQELNTRLVKYRNNKFKRSETNGNSDSSVIKEKDDLSTQLDTLIEKKDSGINLWRPTVKSSLIVQVPAETSFPPVKVTESPANLAETAQAVKVPPPVPLKPSKRGNATEEVTGRMQERFSRPIGHHVGDGVYQNQSKKLEATFASPVVDSEGGCFIPLLGLRSKASERDVQNEADNKNVGVNKLKEISVTASNTTLFGRNNQRLKNLTAKIEKQDKEDDLSFSPGK